MKKIAIGLLFSFHLVMVWTQCDQRSRPSQQTSHLRHLFCQAGESDITADQKQYKKSFRPGCGHHQIGGGAIGWWLIETNQTATRSLVTTTTLR
jgi:hypothetical protein